MRAFLEKKCNQYFIFLHFHDFIINGTTSQVKRKFLGFFL